MKTKALTFFLCALASPVFAAGNLFSVVAVTKAPTTISAGRTGVAYYKVTNNVGKTFTNLGVKDLPSGITQNPVGAGLTDGLVTCREPFTLSPGGSCLLKLNIDGSALTGHVSTGPVVCEMGTSYCSSPGSRGDVLNITKQTSVPSNAPVLSINPSNLSLVTGGLQTITVTNTSSTVTVNNIIADFSNTALAGKVETITPNPGGGNECTSVAPGASCVLSLVSYSQAPLIPTASFMVHGANSKSTPATASVTYARPSATYRSLLRSPLVNADVWASTPEIMSANYAFEGIQAAPNGQANVINAGGAWNTISTPDAPYGAYTATGDTGTIGKPYGYTVYYDDALPICFSEPVLPSTINPTDFRLTLNNNEVVTPDVASLTPNFFYNESSCVVMFGRFGNRIPPGHIGAVYPTRVSIVQGSSNGQAINLTLVGLGNKFTSMVGHSIASGNPYEKNGGPTLLAAKLSVMSAVGQDTQPLVDQNVPNDGITLYGAANAQYRLRMYTSGGFALGNFTPSSERPMSLMPSDYDNFFRVQLGPDSDPFYLYKSGHEYHVPGYGNIEVVGLASLGNADLPENDAYVADNNNYIDIVLKGNLAAIERITYVDIPAGGTNLGTNEPYLKLYNPGGPGNDPTPGITYTQPGPSVHMPVSLALSNARTVTYYPPDFTYE